MKIPKMLFVVLLTVSTSAAYAADALPKATSANETSPTGEALAHTCAACHGTYGRLEDDHFVPLAGMKPEQFIDSMKAFKDLKRPSSIMSHIAEGYSNQDIERMSEFFASVDKEKTNE